MHKYKIIWIVLLLVTPYSNNLFAQEKFEKESRIKQEEIPSKASQFINSLNFENKIKWYREEGISNESIEAKFKRNKARYSIEFDTLGNIEDVEIEIPWEDLSSQLKQSISSHLEKDCLKHKIVKVQIQYLGSEADLLSKLIAKEISQQLTVNYELIVKCTSEKNVDLFEYLFNESGQALSTSKIVFKNSSHLEY